MRREAHASTSQAAASARADLEAQLAFAHENGQELAEQHDVALP